jgi:hypothetical protein
MDKSRKIEDRRGYTYATSGAGPQSHRRPHEDYTTIIVAKTAKICK